MMAILQLVTFALLACLPAVSPAQEAREAGVRALGRLFLTPQERQELDRRRLLNIQEVAVPKQQAQEIIVNGLVTRSGGKTTTWINGIPYNDAYRPADPAVVTLPAEEAGISAEIKVGQTLDTARNIVRDSLGGGNITVRPGGTARGTHEPLPTR